MGDIESDAIPPSVDGQARGGPRIRLLLAEGHRVVGEALADRLAAQPDIEVVGRATDAEGALALAVGLRADVVVLGSTLAAAGLSRAVERLARERPATRIVALSGGEEVGAACPGMRAGPVVRVPGDASIDDLVDAVRTAAGRRTDGAPARDASGRPVVAVPFVQDVPDRRRIGDDRVRARDEAQRLLHLESLATLAGGVAHHFNNLLTSILGNAELALEELPADRPACRLVENVIKSASQAADLSRKMLACSGKGSFSQGPMDLHEAVVEAARMLRNVLPPDAGLEIATRPGLPWIEADPDQVRQVILNLVLNAAEALNDARGSIGIRTDVWPGGPGALDGFDLTDRLAPDRNVLLEVRDNGCGMDDATRARIFEPFFTTRFTGRGLGLAVVQGIVRGHHGAIRVDSRPGRGTVFRILFRPATRPERRRAGPAGPKP